MVRYSPMYISGMVSNRWHPPTTCQRLFQQPLTSPPSPHPGLRPSFVGSGTYLSNSRTQIPPDFADLFQIKYPAQYAMMCISRVASFGSASHRRVLFRLVQEARFFSRPRFRRFHQEFCGARGCIYFHRLS